MSSRRRAGALVSAVVGIVTLLSAPVAFAGLGVVPEGLPGGVVATTSTDRAGVPADALMAFSLSLDSSTPWPGPNVGAGERPEGKLRDVVVDLPAGLNGNGQAIPQCAELIDVSACPVSSQIGVADVKAVTIWSPEFEERNRLILPLYNMTPSFGEVARLGASSGQISLQLAVTLRPSDLGVSVEARRITSFLPLISASISIWGLPGDPVHDSQRCRRLSPLPLSGDFETAPFCNAASGQPNQQPQPFEGEIRPFLVNPTTCGLPRVSRVSVSGWDDPGHFTTEQATAPPISGCDQLDFEPQVAIERDSSAADTPTGLELELTVPPTGD